MPEYAPQRNTVDDRAEPVRRRTILVVEDDAFVRALLLRTLETLGYDVRIAATGAEALALWDAQPEAIDAVLCDVVLPGICGPDAVQHMLESALCPPAVIFMSGYSDHPRLRDARLPAAPYFLQKPLRRAALATMLQEALASRPERAR